MRLSTNVKKEERRLARYWREFPWLWAIRQGWFPIMNHVSVCRANKILLTRRVVELHASTVWAIAGNLFNPNLEAKGYSDSDFWGQFPTLASMVSRFCDVNRIGYKLHYLALEIGHDIQIIKPRNNRQSFTAYCLDIARGQ